MTTEALDPDLLRDRGTMLKGLRPGGVSVPLLIVATLVASPAVIQCLHHSITFTTLMERWVAITLGCWAISEGVRRYVARAQKQNETSDPSTVTDETSVSPATPDVLPIDTLSP
ncbi:hypothetical protein [Nocardioides sp. Kera G14]|uniref:hypothetical protein n=1 Tax=Nocardioides sp. Kera G14 TaxID=2884264 RepID=UPI001D11783A|nr:hypothetical protein [Nocardioides sp. Kera G14]UDY24042.1 hypothetical protein LH076_01735 [Nocardioides sp. Kera G14]